MRQSNARLAVALLGAAAACCSRGKSRAEGGLPAGSSLAPTLSAVRPVPSVRAVGNEPAVAGPKPVDEGAARTPPAVACYAGFTPSGVPRVDVVRLGVSCGPSTGLTQLARINGVVDEASSGPKLRWDADRRDCFRLFAVASDPVEELEVDVKGPHGSFASTTNQNRRWLVVGEDGFFCAPQKGQFEAVFSTHAGRGEVSAAVWRGAHMVPRHSEKPASVD